MSSTSKFKATPTYSFKGKTTCIFFLIQGPLLTTFQVHFPLLIVITQKKYPLKAHLRLGSHNLNAHNGNKLKLNNWHLDLELIKHFLPLISNRKSRWGHQGLSRDFHLLKISFLLQMHIKVILLSWNAQLLHIQCRKKQYLLMKKLRIWTHINQDQGSTNSHSLNIKAQACKQIVI